MRTQQHRVNAERHARLAAGPASSSPTSAPAAAGGKDARDRFGQARPVRCGLRGHPDNLQILSKGFQIRRGRCLRKHYLHAAARAHTWSARVVAFATAVPPSFARVASSQTWRIVQSPLTTAMNRHSPSVMKLTPAAGEEFSKDSFAPSKYRLGRRRVKGDTHATGTQHVSNVVQFAWNKEPRAGLTPQGLPAAGEGGKARAKNTGVEGTHSRSAW